MHVVEYYWHKRINRTSLVHCKPLNIICWVSKKPIFGFADIKLVLLINEGVWFDVVLSFQCR